MARLKKILIGGSVALAVLVGGAVAFASLKKPDQRPAPDWKVEAKTDDIARGKYLANHVLGCFDCHSERDWTKYGGPIRGAKGVGSACWDGQYEMPGKLCFPNITPHQSAGIGAWSDGELARAIREGVDREGNALFPLMPYKGYRELSDGDTRALIAYLKSVPAADGAQPETEIDFPVSFFIKLVPKPLDGEVPEPKRDDPVAYGRYLTTVAGCKSCHTPVDDKRKPIEGKEFAGGQTFTGPWGTITTPNITAHETGIGSHTKESFVALFKSYQKPEMQRTVEPSANTVMPWLGYAGMSESDLGAIYAYLRTVPKQDNAVKPR